MNRRSFIASLAGLAGGLVLPYEPQRVYSFPSGPTIWTPRINGQVFDFAKAEIVFDGVRVQIDNVTFITTKQEHPEMNGIWVARAGELVRQGSWTLDGGDRWEGLGTAETKKPAV